MVFCSPCLSMPQSQYIDCFISQCSSFSDSCHSLGSVSLPLSISDAFTTFSLCLINSSTQHGFPDHERAASPVIDYDIKIMVGFSTAGAQNFSCLYLYKFL